MVDYDGYMDHHSYDVNMDDARPRFPVVPNYALKLNVYRFKILDTQQIGPFLVVKAQYPNVKQFDGIKILVYEDMDLETLSKQPSLDPHFSENTKAIYPIARFVPTTDGWLKAVKLCDLLVSEQYTPSF